MVEIETVSIVFTGLSISLAAFYYISTLRNAQRTQQLQLETRQAQLFMQIFGRFNELSFVDQINEVRFQWSYSDTDDFTRKYGYNNNPKAWNTLNSIIWYFEGLGVLIYRELIKPELVDDLMSGVIITVWEKLKPSVDDMRTRYDWPTAGEWFEYLYNQIKTIYNKQHPEYADKQIRVFRE